MCQAVRTIHSCGHSRISSGICYAFPRCMNVQRPRRQTAGYVCEECAGRQEDRKRLWKWHRGVLGEDREEYLEEKRRIGLGLYPGNGGGAGGRGRGGDGGGNARGRPGRERRGDGGERRARLVKKSGERALPTIIRIEGARGRERERKDSDVESDLETFREQRVKHRLRQRQRERERLARGRRGEEQLRPTRCFDFEEVGMNHPGLLDGEVAPASDVGIGVRVVGRGPELWVPNGEVEEKRLAKWEEQQALTARLRAGGSLTRAARRWAIWGALVDGPRSKAIESSGGSEAGSGDSDTTMVEVVYDMRSEDKENDNAMGAKGEVVYELNVMGAKTAGVVEESGQRARLRRREQRGQGEMEYRKREERKVWFGAA